MPFNGNICKGKEPKKGLYMGDDLMVMAITQFEDTHARHAFPCYFYEPHLKASFSLSIGRHKDEVTCSNAADLALGLPMLGSKKYV